MLATAERLAALDRALRVVIVEDAPSDAALMQRILTAGGLKVESIVVGTELELAAALHDFGPDVVLTDNQLPRFSGRQALRMARERDPSLPVIMVSGTTREDEMVSLLREGLADYIIKDSLLRLPAAVLDALELAEVQRAAARDRAALLASERRFRTVAEASGDGLLITDESGTVVYANAAAGRLFNCPPTMLTGQPLSQVLPGCTCGAAGAPGACRAKAEPIGTAAAPFTTELSAVRCTGEPMQLDVTVSFWWEDARRLASVQLRDITTRIEEARARAVLSQVVEQSANSVVITDTAGTIEYVNRSFERLTGYTALDVIGQTPRVLKSGAQAADVYERLWGQITQGRTFSAEFSNRRKNGAVYTQQTTIFPILDEDGRAVRFVGVGVDITQERLLEQQLRQSQKMEMLGQLAGGIAHDFNNTLTGVLANAALLDDTLAAEATEQRELAQAVMAAARRGADLVKQLMTLSRGRSGAERLVDIRTALDEAARTARRLLPESIEIAVTHANDGLAARLDEGALHQAMLNLCTNARDAMPNGGRLALATRAEANHVVIEVTDGGVGMAPEVLDRAFEPFFTTKEPGKGTGLGLPMVFGFVKRANGTIDIDSAPGQGTTIRLRLPRTVAHPVATTPASALETSTATVPQARATILLVEDQEDLRDVARRVLERLGHHVLTAGDGDEAFALLTSHRGRLDLVLTDFVLPRGGGEKLYREAEAWADRPQFLFMSGYAPGDMAGTRALPPSVPFLPKPWSAAQLEAAVASAMRREVA